MLSAVILAHNDESKLAKTLDSLSFCDERIVIDDFSTDKTIIIAKKSGAQVYQHHLDEDFAGQRNFGLSKAKGEWVLFVDSDEIVSGKLANEIKNAVESVKLGMSTYNGYYLKRKDWMWEKWLHYGETSKVRLLRLGKKGLGEWRRSVHEIWNIKGPIGKFSTPLEHFPHQNVAQFINEINEYSTLNAKYLKKQGIKSSWWQIIVYPGLKFFVDYFVYLGFLDGTAGAVVAILMSFHSFLTRAKLYLLT